MSVYDFCIGITAAVGDPGAIARVEHGFERGDQAARRNDHVDRLPSFLAALHQVIDFGAVVPTLDARLHHGLVALLRLSEDFVAHFGDVDVLA